jgi:hypothetical protein
MRIMKMVYGLGVVWRLGEFWLRLKWLELMYGRDVTDGLLASRGLVRGKIWKGLRAKATELKQAEAARQRFGRE